MNLDSKVTIGIGWSTASSHYTRDKMLCAHRDPGEQSKADKQMAHEMRGEMPATMPAPEVQ